MDKTLRTRVRDGWTTKQSTNLPNNFLTPEEIDDNFLAMEDLTQTLRYDLAAPGGADLVDGMIPKFNSVSDMVSAEWLEIGMIVDTLAYYGGWAATVEGPSGGCRYRIITSGSEPEDGGSRINLSGISGQAKAIFKGNIVTNKQFGAYGNATVDDSGFISSALKYLFSVNGGRLIVDGTSVIDSTVLTPQPIENPTQTQINSSLRYESRISINAANQGDGFKAGPNLVGPMFHCTCPINFKYLQFDGDLKAGITGIYIDYFVGHARQKMKELYFLQFENSGECISADGSSFVVDTCTFRRPRVGVRFGDRAMNSIVRGSIFTGNSKCLAHVLFTQIKEDGVPQGNVLEGNTMIGNGHAVLCHGSYVLSLRDNIFDVTTDEGGTLPLGDANIGVKFESIELTDPDTMQTFWTKSEHVTIDGNWISGARNQSGGGNTGRSLWIGKYCRDFRISNNTFPQSTPVFIGSSQVVDEGISDSQDFGSNGVSYSIRMTNNGFVNAYEPNELQKMLIVSNVRSFQLGDGNEFSRCTYSIDGCQDTIFGRQNRIASQPSVTNIKGKFDGWLPTMLTVTSGVVGDTPITFTQDCLFRVMGNDVEVNIDILVSDLGVGNDGAIRVSGLPIARESCALSAKVGPFSGSASIASGTDEVIILKYDGTFPLGAPGRVLVSGKYIGANSVFDS